MSGIIVGVDGSEPARQALGWAMAEAAQHHFPLTVVAVQRSAARPATEIYWPVLHHHDPEQDAEPARKAVRDLVDKVAGETGAAVPDVQVSVTTGHPAEELIRAAQDADLLVVGAHGSGHRSGRLLGSVTSQVVHHASCPVVVVPGARQDA